MTYLETSTANAIPAAEPGMADDQDAQEAHDDAEQVAIEALHVGDYLVVDRHACPTGARCVIAKRAKANERTGRVVGWLVEMSGPELAWWRRGAMVWRRRIDACGTAPQVP